MPYSSVLDRIICATIVAGSRHKAEKDNSRRRTQDDVLERLANFADDTPPYSWRACAVAAVAVGCAWALRAALELVGTDVRFATFFPAVLFTGLLAGTPAAVGAAFASAIIVYWAFIPPQYQYTPLTRDVIIALAIWLVTAGVLVLFTHYGRLLLKRVRTRQQEQEMIAKELEHRGRNTYAVIQSIIHQTLEDQPERAESILGRIRSVKFANDLIMNPLAQSTFLDAILSYEFAPYGNGRYVGVGPEVELDPETARFVVLLVHELVTNAAKHGVPWRCRRARSMSHGKSRRIVSCCGGSKLAVVRFLRAPRAGALGPSSWSNA
ncbi:MAG: sensor histidine kinase [Bradyrhizobium sp.]|nr:sensor histidine kinase [Bradyrhizobium sp.]